MRVPVALRSTQFIGSILVVLLVGLLAACLGSGSGPPPRLPLISARIASYPLGAVPPGFTSTASVAVMEQWGIGNITDAAVSMNGVALTYRDTPGQLDMGSSGVYEGTVVVAPGAAVTLRVTVDGRTYSASSSQSTSYPTISAPASGASWAPSSINTVTWSGGSPTANAVYRLGVLDAATPNEPPWNWLYKQEFPTSTTSHSIPAYSLTGGSRLVVAGIRTVTDIPDAMIGSRLEVAGYSYVPITVTGMPVTARMSGNAATPHLRGVVWSGTQFAAVGSGGTIFTSPDGISWTLRDKSLPNYSGVDLRDIVWSGTQFAAVAGDSSGSIRTSPDGVTWTLRTSGIVMPLFGITWSGAQFVAVGDNKVYTSSDGITWISRAPGASYYSLRDVTWSGTQFVAVGLSGAILTSADGISWTPRTSGTTSHLYGIAWSGTQFMAVGANGTALTSPDGVSWTSHTPAAAIELYGVTWSGTQFVIVGFYAMQGLILTSPDGLAYTQNASGTTNPLYGVAWSGANIAFVGAHETILTSP